MKNGSEPISIYSFSRRIRIWIQNWTKTGPKADFDQFSKNYVFHKNLDFYRAAAAAARPFLISLSLRGLICIGQGGRGVKGDDQLRVEHRHVMVTS